MSRVILSPEAEHDLWEIARYIARRNIRAAFRFIDVIYAKGELLATHPDIGRVRSELAPDLRSFPVGAFVLFYRGTPSGIEVARILRGSRDIPSLF